MRKVKNQELLEFIEGFKAFKNAAYRRIKGLDEDRNSIKANQQINDFIALKKADILALTANEREILIFKVLKALCWSELDE